MNKWDFLKSIILSIILLGTLWVFTFHEEIFNASVDYDEEIRINLISQNEITITLRIPAILYQGELTPATQKLIEKYQSPDIKINTLAINSSLYLEINGTGQQSFTLDTYVILNSFLNADFSKLETGVIFLYTSDNNNITLDLYHKRQNGAFKDNQLTGEVWKANLEIELKNGWHQYNMSEYLEIYGIIS